tara:strand:+ start:695 stop:2005 length:1311 start_codon:yes stop_codon:yes gene_type:complete
MTRSNQPNPSRRKVLGGAAAAAGAITLGCKTTGSHLDRDIPVAPDKDPMDAGATIRIGMIGVGGMGGGHMNGLLDQAKRGDDKHEVVALCDVAQPRLDDRLAQARAKAPDTEITGYTRHEDLLARDDIDCVLIASTEHWHAQHAVDAIAAGKDVYVEKPMTLRLDDALWMYRVMEANPHMRLQVGTQYMMGEKYGHARRLIAEGRIGHPTFSQTSYCRNSKGGEWLYGIDDRIQPGDTLDWERWCGPLGPREWDTEIYHRWRRYKDFSTGIIGDLLVHQMTPLAWALDSGWPTRVTACGGHYVDKAMENHDQINMTVQWEKEHTMIVAGATCNELGLDTLVRGHEGNIRLGGANCILQPERIFVDDVDEERINCKSHDDQGNLRLDWLKAVRTRGQSQSQIEMATKIMVAVDLATRSIWEGKAFAYDSKTMTARAL